MKLPLLIPSISQNFHAAVCALLNAQLCMAGRQSSVCQLLKGMLPTNRLQRNRDALPFTALHHVFQGCDKDGKALLVFLVARHKPQSGEAARRSFRHLVAYALDTTVIACDCATNPRRHVYLHIIRMHVCVLRCPSRVGD